MVVVGDLGVGKTKLLEQFIEGRVADLDAYEASIGVEFRARLLHLDEKTIKLQIWDFSGDLKFRQHVLKFVKASHLAVIVFDATKQESFLSVPMWLEHINERASAASKLLVGSKYDLGSERVVDSFRAKELADQAGIPFVEVSVKDSGLCIEHAIVSMAAHYLHTQPPPVDHGGVGGRRCNCSQAKVETPKKCYRT